MDDQKKIKAQLIEELADLRGQLHHKEKTKTTFKDSEEKYQTLLENIEDGYYEVDLSGKYTIVNRSVCRYHGRSAEELLGQSYRVFLPTPEASQEIYKVFNQVFRTGQPAQTFEYQILRKGGEIRDLEVSASLIRDAEGNPIGFRGISRDITKRKRMEAENQRYRDFVENVNDGCFETDLSGKLTFSNQISQIRFGFTKKDFERIDDRGSYITPEAAQKIEKIFNEVYQTGLPSKPFEHEVTDPDGETRFLEMVVSLIRDSAGKPTGFRGISREVTGRKKMEAETQHLTEQLNQARKLEAIGTLAGGVAHDFNNLLMGIQGYASLMLLDLDPSHPFYEKLKAIEDQVKSAAGLTSQLLGYARGGRYEVRATNLNDLIGKTASLFGRTKKEIRIHETFAEKPWIVEVDQGQMEQVFLNLFMNAWQAMPGGGVLYLGTENVLLDESYIEPYGTKPGPYLKVSVTDTGVGMDKETRERIFEPFFTTKEMGRGIGLGLATVYGMVRGHGGIINVYSEKGYGTTFNLYFPASEKEIPAEKQSSPGLIKGQETVLLVDDEKIIADTTGAMLKRLGYQLLTAHSGEEAVEVFREYSNRINVVILDMVMPGIGGSVAFDLIQSMDPQVKIILSSGFSLNGQAKEILQRGARSFLQKPFQIEELSRIIREVLDTP
jgi:PAS domain S-box-containing protein